MSIINSFPGGGGDKYTAGDGIDIDNNAISTERMTAEEIADLDIVTPGQSSGLVYDLRGTEMVVGKVIEADGTEKTLYKKTIDCGALPNNTTKSVAHGINNLDIIYNIQGVAIVNSGGVLPIPYIGLNALSEGIEISLNSDRATLNIRTGMDRSNRQAYVTLLYTKTTD